MVSLESFDVFSCLFRRRARARSRAALSSKSLEQDALGGRAVGCREVSSRDINRQAVVTRVLCSDEAANDSREQPVEETGS